MAKTIIIIVLLAVCVGLIVWRIIDPGPDTEGIADLERTIEEYGETIKSLEAENQRFENTIGELQEHIKQLVVENQKLEKTISELPIIISEAESTLHDAIETTDRIKKLSEQIKN